MNKNTSTYTWICLLPGNQSRRIRQTEETGHLYADDFSEEFLAQNVNFVKNVSWLGENIVIKVSNGKRNP